MDTSRYARFTRPGHRVTGDRSQQSRRWTRPETRVGYEYAHAVVDDHSRLAYVELHPRREAPPPSQASPSGRSPSSRRTASFAKRLMTDNAFSYVKNRSLARTARPARDPPPHHQAVPAAHEREGGALPPDDGARMGVRARLPLLSTPRRGAATLAQPLQPATAAQLNQRPATDQSRSQRLWVGQLGTAARLPARRGRGACRPPFRPASRRGKRPATTGSG